jgi:DNA-binding transcriptional regulator YbjK
MVKTNPTRRNHLLDAAIEVLARHGAHGLTYRAVDEHAAVPVGTASNYFRSRDELFQQTGRRARDRYRAQVRTQSKATSSATGPEALSAIARATVRDALTRDRSLYLAMFELRMECTRNPALQELFTDLLTANLEEDMRLHAGPHLACTRHDMAVLTHALTGILLIQLTTPDIHDPTAPDALIATLIDRFVTSTPTGAPADAARNDGRAGEAAAPGGPR